MQVNRKVLRLMLAACAVGALFALVYPMYVIYPFRAQGARELAVALAVRRWGPAAAMAAAALAIAATVALWRSSGRWARAFHVITAAAALLFAALSRVNVYELMFHRIDIPVSVAADAAKLDGDDMVIAIHVEGQARAYPVRMMGYHHIVNDSLGGVPVAATY